MSATIASERYETVLAPASLLLTQEITNSVPYAEHIVDLLGEAATAQQWLGDVAAVWCAEHGTPMPDLTMSEPGLRRLRKLRTQLRQMTGQDPRDLSFTAAASIVVTQGKAALVPSGSGAAWVESAIATELLVAEQQGELRRLKLCHNQSCGVTFYDRTKNNGRVWHNFKDCGNPTNVRNHRARKAASTR